MSVEATTRVLDRTMNDEAFLDRFRTDPEAALAGYELTPGERAALVAGDESEVRDHLDDIALATAVVVVIISP